MSFFGGVNIIIIIIIITEFENVSVKFSLKIKLAQRIYWRSNIVKMIKIHWFYL